MTYKRNIKNTVRKRLWGASGNRCAMCRQPLVIEASTPHDIASVVGIEAHIISPRKSGPRFSAVGAEEYDSFENLILLCPKHHKQVDDQTNQFSVERLRQIKEKHGQWVESSLTESEKSWPPRVRWDKPPVKLNLALVATGKELLQIVRDTYAGRFDQPELISNEEVELIGGFFEIVQDYADIIDDLGATDALQIEYDLTKQIHGLAKNGLLVYGGQYIRELEVNGQKSPWPECVINVVRSPQR